MKKALVEGFLAFVKEQYGITMTAKESDHGESFKDIYGYEFDDVHFDPVPYSNGASEYMVGLPTAIYDDDYVPAA